MRTTVTLDPDVAAKLRETAREDGISFKQALNSAVRRGYARGGSRPSEPYRLPPAQPMEARPGIDLVKALQLAGQLEDEETMRKMQVGK